MHFPINAIPPEADLAGMGVAYTRMPRGVDFDEMLEGLPGRLCPCPHWGYLLEGRVVVTYDDGSEEAIAAGEVYYLKAGHTAVVEEDCASIDFSPIGPWRDLLQHLASKAQAT